MTKEQALQAFRDNQPVAMKDSCLYQIVEINLNNGEVLLDKVWFRKGELRSYHLPKVLAKWEDLFVPGLLQFVNPPAGWQQRSDDE